MRKNLILAVLGVVSIVVAIGFVQSENGTMAESTSASTFYDINVLDIEGNDVNLGKYKDNVVMFVNTASQCGYTPQYKGLQAIYDKYKDRGFVVLGFPANNFGGQEPGSNKEIKEFCTLRYKVSFPMLAKISVKGDDKHPLYQLLTSNDDFGGDVTWNFNKFLASHDGTVIARFSSKETPESKGVTEAIEAALMKLESSAEKKAAK